MLHVLKYVHLFPKYYLTGNIWKKHRKIITPAFHFKILENFVGVFNSVNEILIETLRKETGKESFDIFPFLSLYALDVICGIAFCNLNATFSEIVNSRMCNGSENKRPKISKVRLCSCC